MTPEHLLTASEVAAAVGWLLSIGLGVQGRRLRKRIEILMVPALPAPAPRDVMREEFELAMKEQVEHEKGHHLPYLAHHRAEAVAQRIQRARHIATTTAPKDLHEQVRRLLK
jgi:hypothetical protein